MPKNNRLPIIPLPMKNRRNTPIGGEIVNDLKNIKVKLVNHTNFNDLLNYIPGFVEMTWAEKPMEREFSKKQKYQCVFNTFKRRTLPTSLETIRFDFLIDGFNIQDVTHLLRHRTFSFSSQCTGDRDLRNHKLTIPEAVQNSVEFKERYEKLMKDCVQLYSDMVDSDKISMMDARLCLPKCHDTSYYASCNFKDLIAFLNQRKDQQIQPSSDVVLAMLMYKEICKVYPIACLNLVDFDGPDNFYIMSAQQEHSTRLYAPEPKNDKFEWNEKSFIYGNRRKSQVAGTDAEELVVFKEIKDDFDKWLNKSKIDSKEVWARNDVQI